MNESDLRQIIREELETVLRRVVREELAARLAQSLAPPSLPTQSLEEFLTSFAHPYSLSERELCQAESLMSPEEAAIYRKRCYAWRAARGGNEKAARMLRGQADRMEKDLIGRRADKRIS